MSAFSLARDAVGRTLAVPWFLTTGLMDLVLPPACRFCEGPLDAGRQTSQSFQHDSPIAIALPHFCSACLRSLSVSEPMMRNACKKCGMPPAGISPRPPIEGPIAENLVAENLVAENPAAEAAENPIAEGSAAEDDASDPDSQNLHCQTCRDEKFDFDAVIALWIYRDRVCDAIVASKYGHNASLADALGDRLGVRVSDDLVSDPPSEVTFVPSHLFRQFSRGGIGTQAIAQAVASRLNIPLSQRLKAIRPIAKQAWLDDDHRKQNVHGAFAARKSYAFARSPKLDHRHILVIDDVLTTGATANEVARVLKDSGAARVTVAVVSRAVRTR